MEDKILNEHAGTVGSLERGLHVLETVRSSLMPLSLAQIAEETDLDPSTTLRCLKVLQRRGYVFRLEPSKCYTVGRAVLAPAGQTEVYFDFRRDVHGHLRHLVAETQMTSTLVLLYGSSRVALEIVRGRDRLVPYNAAEITGPLHSTVSGKLWLLAQPRAAMIAALTEKPLQQYSEATRTDSAALIAEIDAARVLNYVETRDETVSGVYGLGAPIRARDGRILAGIGLYAASRGVTPEAAAEAAKLLVETTALVSETAESIDRIARLMR